MKIKGVIALGLLILFLGFSFATDVEEITETADKLTKGVDDFTEAVDLETGEVDIDALNNLLGMPKTKIEQRIDNVNVWLDNNVSWLSFIFRIKPQLSWEFLLNLYLILVGITYLILNGKKYMPVGGEVTPYIVGAGFFIVFLFTDVFLFFARLFLNLIDIVWNVFLPISLWVSLIIIIILLVLLSFAPGFAIKLITLITRLILRKSAEKKMKEGAQYEKLNQTLDKIESFYKGLQGKT